MHRSIPASALISLKAATKDLVDAVDGIHRAAKLCSTSPNKVRRWYAERSELDPDEPSLATIDALSIVLLERDLAARGSPSRPVTECLVRLAGLELRGADDVTTARTVAAATGRFVAASGEATATIMDALADGVVTPTEALRADQALGRAIAFASDARAQFANVRAKTSPFNNLDKEADQ